MKTIEQLAEEWEQIKAAEEQIKTRRREIEDEITELLNLPKDLDQQKTHDIGFYKLKVTGRIDRKVDADKLQALAEEAGLTEHLGSLFRWKPEINLPVWKAAHTDITGPLLDAITTKAARPSYAITRKD